MYDFVHSMWHTQPLDCNAYCVSRFWPQPNFQQLGGDIVLWNNIFWEQKLNVWLLDSWSQKKLYEAIKWLLDIMVCIFDYSVISSSNSLLIYEQKVIN